MPKDLDQAAKMVNMRIKIDVWTQGLDESFRDKVRENLRELFCQLPPRRVWYYLKRIRHMLLRDRIMLGPQPVPDHLEGPEDVIVNGKHQFYDTFTSSSHFLTSQHSKSPIPHYSGSLPPDAFRDSESCPPPPQPGHRPHRQDHPERGRGHPPYANKVPCL